MEEIVTLPIEISHNKVIISNDIFKEIVSKLNECVNAINDAKQELQELNTQLLTLNSNIENIREEDITELNVKISNLAKSIKTLLGGE